MHIVVGRVVHDRVREHEHNVPLEDSRRLDHARLNILLDRRQVHRAKDDATVAGRDLVSDWLHENGGVFVTRDVGEDHHD